MSSFSRQIADGDFTSVHVDYIEPIFAKWTSRRIYGELYKVIDSSDVTLHILNACDPLGTMCESVLEYLKKEKAHKQVVLIINKCDLVPNWVTVSLVRSISEMYRVNSPQSRGHFLPTAVNSRECHKAALTCSDD